MGGGWFEFVNEIQFLQMIYLILPLNRNKLNNNSISKLRYNYFDINMNTTIIITNLKTIRWIML